jgi:Uma2 family endonuclease
MVTVALQKKYTVEEYLEFEELSDVRHEFYFGELYPIENTTKTHNRIKRNFAKALDNAFDERDCDVFDENVKVEIVKNGRYVYPDVVLSCDDDKKDEYIVRKPVLIVEVLSKSTGEYDRGDKFKLYQKLPSVKHYLLIDSRQVDVELFSRANSRSLWTYQNFTSLEDIVDFPDLPFTISLQSIYERITFENQTGQIL